jgi:NitT/TauT family transport system permease protein
MADRMLRLGIYPAILLLWAVAAAVTGVMSPLTVLDAFTGIVAGSAFLHTVGITVLRVLVGTAIVFVVGTVLVLAARLHPVIDSVVNEIFFGSVYAVPPIILVFLVLVVFGLSPLAPVAVVALLAMPHFLINVQEGIKDLDQEVLDAARVAGADRWSMLRSVILPLLVPQLMTAFRSVFNTAWKVIVLAEFFTATEGIGYELQTAVQSYDLPVVAAWTLFLMALIVGMDRAIRVIDGRYLGRYRAA